MIRTPIRTSLALACAVLALLASTSFATDAHARDIRVGVVFDGPPKDEKAVLSGISEAISEVSMGDYAVVVTHSLTGDWTAATAMSNLATLQGKRDVDVIIAAGVIASNASYGMKTTKKPLIAPLGIKLGEAGPSNDLNLGFGWVWDFNAGLDVFQRLVTSEKLAVIVHPEMMAIPGFEAALTAVLPPGSVLVRWDTDGATTAAALPEGVDSVYVGADIVAHSGLDVDGLAEALKTRKLPSFAMAGATDVSKGLLAGIGEPPNRDRLIRWISVQGSLAGMKRKLTSRQSVRDPEVQLHLNVATAEAIGLEIPWSVTANAKTYGKLASARKDGRQAGALTLGAAAREAIANNLQAKVAAQGVLSVRETVNQGRAPLLPQLDAYVNGTVIDSDRARAALGNQPQGEMKVGAALTQILYDEQSWTNLSVSGFVLDQALASEATTLLNVIAEAGNAYLAIQLARANVKIQQEQLRQSQINLNLSETKSRIGSGARGDVLRWESQVASDQSTLVLVATKLTLAELDLARILNRRQHQAVPTQPSSFDDERFSGPQVLRDALASPRGAARLERYLVEVGQAAAPELREVKASVDRSERVAEGASRTFWAPQVALNAGIDYRFVRAGAGKDRAVIPGFGQGPDDLDFYATVQLKLPIFTGLARKAVRDEARSESLKFQQIANYQRDIIEQRVRSSVRLASGAFAQVKFLKEAAVAARANLDLVNDGYKRGAFDITRVIDALNASRVADQTAVSAEFGYQTAILALYRSISGYYFLMTDKEKDDFKARISEAVNTVKATDAPSQ